MQTPRNNLDLGIIGNCQIAALLDARARMVWACWPQFDADPEFCRLLLDDAAQADEIFSILMGEDVESRRSFIQRNAKDVRFLDI